MVTDRLVTPGESVRTTPLNGATGAVSAVVWPGTVPVITGAPARIVLDAVVVAAPSDTLMPR